MRDVVIIGAGGHGRVVADIVAASGDKVIGFLDDVPRDRCMGPISDYVKYLDAKFVIAIGNAGVRERLVNSMGCRWYTAIHPSAIISPSASIGEGSVIMPNAVVNAGASVGRHCIINTAAVVEHDNVIEDYVHVSVAARLGGTVSVGEKTWIGIGATVSNNIHICCDCVIGAGAVVTRDIEEPGTYVGVPAKMVSKEF